MKRLIVKREGRFKRVYAEDSFKRGEIVLHLIGKEYTRPTRHTIQLDWNLHILDPIGKHIMHSLDNNVEVKDFNLRALYDINKGDEIKMNYYDNQEIIFTQFVDIETGELVCTKNNPKYGIEC